jgi:hypothetical protein
VAEAFSNLREIVEERGEVDAGVGCVYQGLRRAAKMSSAWVSQR